MGWVQMIFVFLRALLGSQAELAAENLALRQQLAVLQRQSQRPRLRKRDRIFWVWLSKFRTGRPQKRAADRTRTENLRFTKPLLCQLSYGGILSATLC